MINEVNKTEWIEQYLLGTLKGESLKEFKDKLACDDDFFREVELQTNITSMVSQVGRNELRHKLRVFHEEMIKEEHTSRKVIKLGNHKMKIILASAACLGMIFVCTLFVLRFNDITAETAFEQYFEPYPNVISKHYRGQPQSATGISQAFIFYDMGDYPESIRIFEQLLKKENNEDILFYLGNAYLANDNTSKAVTVFTKYLTQYDTFKDESKWYLALSYLKENKHNKAISLLKELTKSENDFSKRAVEILEKLE